jgi:23S rRNA (uridine2552-2'-O)-methyltransferase
MVKDQRDHYYWKAKEDGYRARSSYKLLQINKKFNLIKKGDSVVDLGAAPGGWLQVAKELSAGKIVGVDLQRIEPISGVTTFQGDMTRDETIDNIKEFLGGEADVVISDASPNLSGAWDYDHARSIDLAESALATAEKLLKPRGNFLAKVFQGDMFNGYLEHVRKKFSRVKVHHPPASRKESAEVYVVAKDLLKGRPVKPGEVYDVKITSLGKSGDGVALIDGFAVIIKGTRLGDEVKVRIKDSKPHFAFGEVIERNG